MIPIPTFKLLKQNNSTYNLCYLPSNESQTRLKIGNLSEGKRKYLEFSQREMVNRYIKQVQLPTWIASHSLRVQTLVWQKTISLLLTL